MPTKRQKASGIVEYGVFVWEPSGPGAYHKSRAVKLYASESAAERFATGRNLVVRGLDKDGGWTLELDAPYKGIGKERTKRY